MEARISNEARRFGSEVEGAKRRWGFNGRFEGGLGKVRARWIPARSGVLDVVAVADFGVLVLVPVLGVARAEGTW